MKWKCNFAFYMRILTYDKTLYYILLKAREKYYPNFFLTNMEKKCVLCDSMDEPIIHHIIPISRGGIHSENNVCILCRECHNFSYGPYEEDCRKQITEATNKQGEQIPNFKEIYKKINDIIMEDVTKQIFNVEL